MDPRQEFDTLIRSKYPILYVVSWEEERVEQVLQDVCKKLGRQLHTWSVTQGVQPPIVSDQVQKSLSSLRSELQVLAQIRETSDFRVIVLRDFHAYTKDPTVIRMLRDLASQLRVKKHTLILLSPTLQIPTELEKEITVIEYPLPGPTEINEQIDQVVEAMAGNEQVTVDLKPDEREFIVKAAQGLTLDEISSAFARSLVETKSLKPDQIIEEKKQIIRKSGLLEFYPAQHNLSDVGGLEILKDWLGKRSHALTDKAKEFGIPAPKGVLILGVQGCGKSLVAKAIASQWGLPMLKLDMGRIFGSLVGQSEDNIRRAIRVAESVAPCCLWADELEKGLAGTGGSGVSDSGTTARVFATFLTWMQEKTKPVFLIATANDVSALPPELLRKGRFDEIFFVDLPDLDERAEIFKIHLAKRKRDPEKFDLARLAAETKGFSGAEIEQVVIAGLFLAFEAERDLEMQDLMQEAKSQVPLSRMMAEEIDELRTWASMRARPSSKSSGN